MGLTTVGTTGIFQLISTIWKIVSDYLQGLFQSLWWLSNEQSKTLTRSEVSLASHFPFLLLNGASRLLSS